MSRSVHMDAYMNSHSLVAGYWVPYRAAKAIAETFCWSIRWALTPVFGNDFVYTCIPPQHTNFAKFFINPSIVESCTAETARIKEEGATYQFLQPKAPSLATAPAAPVFCSPAWEAVNRLGDAESGYGTDLERRDNVVFSPAASPLCQRRTSPLNQVGGAGSPTSSAAAYPTAPCSPAAYRMPTPLLLPAALPNMPYSGSFRTKRTHSKVAYNDDGAVVAGKVDPPQDEMSDPLQGEGRSEAHNPCDVAAAETLMALGVVARNAAAMPDPKRSRRGSRL